MLGVTTRLENFVVLLFKPLLRTRETLREAAEIFSRYYGTHNAYSTIEFKTIYSVDGTLMWQYIYRKKKEKNQDSKSYLDFKFMIHLRY